ncbi:YdiU family protein [Pseudoalteromonas sp. JBTF-M23]|uniref:Protein nucleotidyltransferase YdiU n=1 Tax=Pseudoalteromonas caenipelagi TaxID=2726988 RepID=A0A849VMM0_9GAMM|nr:YdiU family protein [Pseudoalteromonas caenipelagi]NOU52881.1 YdiU family protein [Pseudoalteromonas caenipelagi]
MSYFDRYTQLGLQFTVASSPRLANKASTKKLNLLLWNEDVADKYAIAFDKEHAHLYLSGHTPLEGVIPKALAYSGHQFGHFNPTLGDGRAHLIGSFNDRLGQAYDLQLKGSGTTPFSRGGDGLCALGPAVREFVMSQAIGALGVPTTECLSVVTTGEDVYRESPLPGAVLCRVASSHIRIGSFQYLALHEDKEALSQLLDTAIERYYPEIKEQGDARILEFLRAVCKRQVTLIVHWMRIGFVHGVMNTDNILVGGETIDYGPCAMLEQFSFEQVFSSIDRQGRYAFGQQPNIASWNCARLAESLLMLFAADNKQAVAQMSEVLTEFASDFNQQYQLMWANKLGLLDWRDSDANLLSELLGTLKSEGLDYTNSFAALTNQLLDKPLCCFEVPEELSPWLSKWQARIEEYNTVEVCALMRSVNPAIIPRNALIEQVIKDYYEQGDSELLEHWLPLLKDPYRYQEYEQQYIEFTTENTHYKTFCGT